MTRSAASSHSHEITTLTPNSLRANSSLDVSRQWQLTGRCLLPRGVDKSTPVVDLYLPSIDQLILGRCGQGRYVDWSIRPVSISRYLVSTSIDKNRPESISRYQVSTSRYNVSTSIDQVSTKVVNTKSTLCLKSGAYSRESSRQELEPVCCRC